MREILFRGKQIETGEWVEGNFYESGISGVFILQNKTRKTIDAKTGEITLRDEPIPFEVIPSTVGQYTGLKDKNGKRIFEGDIVEGHCHSAWSHSLQRCDIAYGRYGFEARNHIDGVDSDYYTYRVLFSKDVVIIGNIHDNPELLEK